MNRCLTLAILMSLCLTTCKAQTNDSLSVLMTRPLIAMKQGCTELLDPLRNLYYRRTKERIHQLCDYLTLASGPSRKSRVRRYYAACIQNMFHPESLVYVAVGDSVRSYSLKAFAKYLTEPSLVGRYDIRLDSICIPKWDSALIVYDSVGYVLSPSEMMPINTPTFYNFSTSELLINKEETEDGDEWVPQFGDMFVTLKNRKKYEK